MANGWTGDVWKRILGDYFQAYANQDFNTVDERNFAHDAALGVLADNMDDADDPRADVIRRHLAYLTQGQTAPPHTDRAFQLSGDERSGGKRSKIGTPDGSRYLLAHHPRLGGKIAVHLQFDPHGTHYGRVESAAYYSPEEFREFASKHPPEVASQMHAFVDNTHPLPKEPRGPDDVDHNAPVKQKARVGNPSSFSDASKGAPDAVLVAAYAQARAEGDDEACARIRAMAGKRTFAEGEILPSEPSGKATDYVAHTHARFNDAIDANPLEAVNHHVYADFLDEQGHHDEAAFRRSMGDWVRENHGVIHEPKEIHPWAMYNIAREPRGIRHQDVPQTDLNGPGVVHHTPDGFDPDIHALSPRWARTTDPVIGLDADGHGPRWREYRHMEEAFRRAFMANLERQRKPV